MEQTVRQFRQFSHTLILVAITLLACSCAKTINGCKIERATDCRGAILVGADLSHFDLSRADLTDSDLSDADLSGAILRSADLRNANLSGADLTNANLVGAMLRLAKYNANTKWTLGFDPEAEGAVLLD